MHPTADAAASIEMPRYKSHKTVWALEISGVTGTTLTFAEKGYAPISDDPSMFARYWPVAGDFLVHYADGYKSISPRKAFLDGYSLDKPTELGTNDTRLGDTWNPAKETIQY